MKACNLVEKGSLPFVSRRFFLGGLGSFGAFGGARLFAAPAGAFSGGKPNLTFGVVSDIHITKVGANEKMEAWGNNLTFRHTLEWFRDQGVDAVMVVGDMADTGMVDQLQAVAQAWYAVFPDGKAPDGRKVEKLFVYGNHDYHGYRYGDFAQKAFEKERKKGLKGDFASWSRNHVLRSDLGGWWKKIFHEDYSRFYRKTINGYTFLGAHWDDGTGMETGEGSWTFGIELKEFLDRNGGSLDPKLPFFYFQHPHPKDTCYGSWAWGHDNGRSTRALSPFPNAVAFSGHSHYTLTDERSIWQGAFTSVGTSSLRYSGTPYDSRAPFGFENSGTDGRFRFDMDALKVMSQIGTGDCRQGMLWRVYDDHATIQRREFLSDSFVGMDWVMPLGTAAAKPFDFSSRAKKAVAPQFPAGSTVEIKAVKAKNRARDKAQRIEKAAWQLTFPQAFAEASARPFEYEIVAEGGEQPATFRVLPEGFNHAAGHATAKRPGRCVIAQSRLPAGTRRLTVAPLDCWWNRGRALTVEVPAAAPAGDFAWTQDFDAAKAVSKVLNRPMLLDFTGSDWCGWCKLMDRAVFAETAWKAWAANHVVGVTLDFPQDANLVPEKFRARNAKLAEKYGIRGYPTFLLLSPGGEKVLGKTGCPGRDPTPEQFIASLREIIAAK